MKLLENKKFLALVFAICFLPNSLFAQAYFNPKIISPIIIEEPLRTNSEEWQKQIAQIVKMQKSFNQQDLQAAISEHQIKTELLIQEIDPNLNRQNYPKTYILLDRVFETSKAVSDQVKEYWQGKRPYLATNKVKSLVAKPSTNPSYPSGHASYAYSQAYILSLLIPIKKNAFYKQAAKIGEHRVLLGMHYPYDVEAGRELSFLIVGALLNDKQFQKDFEKARTELINYNL